MKMTVQVALCDDEPEELNKMEKILSTYEKKYTNVEFMIEFFGSTDTLLYMIRERKYLPDLIDVEIENMGHGQYLHEHSDEYANKLIEYLQG